MEYAQISNTGEALQITTRGNVKWDANHFCPASALTPDEAALFGVVPLTATEAPAFNPITQSVLRSGCEQVAGVWKYRWVVSELFATKAEKDAAKAADVEAKRLAAIPQAVTMRQARLALLGDGLLATVNSTIAAMAGAAGEAARIEWEFSNEVQRHQPLVLALGPTLGLSAAQLDALFIAAAAL